MPFKRRIDKTRDPVITPPMVSLFEQMKRCSSNAKWWALHGKLWDLYQAALSPRTRPWQWPVIQSPREAEDEGERPEALALWRALNDASREARRAQKAVNSTPVHPAPTG
jgi:hypothetical protein